MKHSLIQEVPSEIMEMVKVNALQSFLQRGLSCYTSVVYQDRRPELGSGVDGYNERLSALEAMAQSQAFMEASGQAAPKDHERQGRIWKGLAQSVEEFGVVDRDGSTPNIVGALKWRLSQDGDSDKSHTSYRTLSHCKEMAGKRCYVTPLPTITPPALSLSELHACP